MGVRLDPGVLDVRQLLSAPLLPLVTDTQAEGQEQQHYPGPDQHVGYGEGLALENAAPYLRLVPLSGWLFGSAEPGDEVPHGHDDPEDQHPQANGSQRVVRAVGLGLGHHASGSGARPGFKGRK